MDKNTLREKIAKILFAELPDKRHEFCDYLAGRIVTLFPKQCEPKMTEEFKFCCLCGWRGKMSEHHNCRMSEEEDIEKIIESCKFQNGIQNEAYELIYPKQLAKALAQKIPQNTQCLGEEEIEKILIKEFDNRGEYFKAEIPNVAHILAGKISKAENRIHCKCIGKYGEDGYCSVCHEKIKPQKHLYQKIYKIQNPQEEFYPDSTHPLPEKPQANGYDNDGNPIKYGVDNGSFGKAADTFVKPQEEKSFSNICPKCGCAKILQNCPECGMKQPIPLEESNTIDNSFRQYIKNKLGQKTEVVNIIHVSAEKKDFETEMEIMKHFSEYHFDFICQDLPPEECICNKCQEVCKDTHHRRTACTFSKPQEIEELDRKVWCSLWEFTPTDKMVLVDKINELVRAIKALEKEKSKPPDPDLRPCPASKAGICVPDERNPKVCMFCGKEFLG